MNRFKRVAAALAATVLVTGVAVVALQSPALATATPCPSLGNQYTPWAGPTWGKISYCLSVNPSSGYVYGRVRVDDTLTDGYVVHAEIHIDTLDPPGTLHDLNNILVDAGSGCSTVGIESAGPVETGCWSSFIIPNDQDPSPWTQLCLIKGQSDNPAIPGHQKIAWYCPTIWQ